MTTDTRPPEALLRKLPEDVLIKEPQDPDRFQTIYFLSTYAARNHAREYKDMASVFNNTFYTASLL